VVPAIESFGGCSCSTEAEDSRPSKDSQIKWTDCSDCTSAIC
jgi:hypothetical protein